MSLVANAADRKQIKRANRKQRERQRISDACWTAVLSSPPGRLVVWEILEWCKTFGSVWDPSARIHYNAGQQDLGHRIMGRIGGLSEDLLFSMMKEASERQRTQKQEDEAEQIERSKSSHSSEPKEEGSEGDELKEE